MFFLTPEGASCDGIVAAVSSAVCLLNAVRVTQLDHPDLFVLADDGDEFEENLYEIRPHEGPWAGSGSVKCRLESLKANQDSAPLQCPNLAPGAIPRGENESPWAERPKLRDDAAFPIYCGYCSQSSREKSVGEVSCYGPSNRCLSSCSPSGARYPPQKADIPDSTCRSGTESSSEHHQAGSKRDTCPVDNSRRSVRGSAFGCGLDFVTLAVPVLQRRRLSIRPM